MKNPMIRRPNDPFAALITLYSAALAPSPPPATARRWLERKTPWAWLRRSVERWAWSARQRELERALASAADLTDVERRLRAVERGTLYRYY